MFQHITENDWSVRFVGGSIKVLGAAAYDDNQYDDDGEEMDGGRRRRRLGDLENVVRSRYGNPPFFHTPAALPDAFATGIHVQTTFFFLFLWCGNPTFCVPLVVVDSLQVPRVLERQLRRRDRCRDGRLFLHRRGASVVLCPPVDRRAPGRRLRNHGRGASLPVTASLKAAQIPQTHRFHPPVHSSRRRYVSTGFGVPIKRRNQRETGYTSLLVKEERCHAYVWMLKLLRWRGVPRSLIFRRG